MRLGLVIYDSLDTLSGGYIYDRELVTYLREQGDTVEIVSIPYRNYIAHLMDGLSSRLVHRLADLQAEALIQDELNHPSLFLLNRRLRKQISYPIVSIIHHLRSSEARSTWQNYIYRSVECCYLSSLDGFICNSLTTRVEVEALLKKPKVRTCPRLVAYPGGDRLHPQINEAEIERRVHDSCALKVLFIGNIIPRKGLHVLLKALKRLPYSQWMLTVVGNRDLNPSYVTAVVRQISQDGLEKNVRFVGILSDHDLAKCMKKSHLLVVPSSYEGYGIVYLEGMGFGLPAIGTTSGAAREIITHNLDGFLISPSDVSTLAAYIFKLTQDRRSLLEMSIAARNRFLSHPTWGESMRDIRAFLMKLVH